MSDVRVIVELAHPADVVWRALTGHPTMNEWFIPTDLAPVQGGVYRAFPPPGLAGFTDPFDIDILEVVECERLRRRWRGRIVVVSRGGGGSPKSPPPGAAACCQ